MSSIAQIPLQVQTPQPTQPLQSIGALMALRGQITENALRQAQIPLYQAQAQNFQAEAAQRQRAVADQQTLQQLIQSDPANAQAYGRGDLSFADGKISPLFQSQVQQQRTQSLLEQAKVPAAQMQNQKDAAAELLQHMDSLRSLTPGERAQQVGTVLNSLSPAVKQAFPQLAQMDPSKLDLSDQGMDRFEAGLGILQGHIQQALANQKTQAETAEATGKGAESQANAAKVNAEQALLAGLKNPGGPEAMAQTVAPVEQYPGIHQQLARELQTATSIQDIAAAKQKASEAIQGLDPQLQAAKAAQARLDAAATEPIRTAGQLALQRQLYGGTGAFQNVAPRLIEPAIKEAQTATDEYANAVNSAQTMADVVNQARQGNKIAYAYAPTTGVLSINTGQGVKRVNMAEISQYGGAGSLLDKVQGFFGKQLSGESIPPDILNAMDQFHSSLIPVAQNRLANKYAGINQNYGSKLDPNHIVTSMNAGQSSPVDTAHQVGDTVSVKGQKVKITVIHPDGTFEGVPQ